MQWIGSFLETEIGIGEIAVRLIVAAFLGAVIGFDREYVDRPAGLRTHILVCLAAATFTVVSLEIAAAGLSGDQSLSLDPTRVVQAVTAGVAFLAAGTIIQSRGKVHGLTTGAGLWLGGAIGTAAGVGALSIAVLATVLGFVVLALLRQLERRLPQSGDSDDRG